MKRICDKFHAKLGDFWWYSLLMLLACRLGDIIQAFISLWLVPRYVGQVELGAVIPLQNLSAFFSTPLAILAAVFAKYINTYTTHGEIGKAKSFIIDVLISSCAVFLLCIITAYIFLPIFYERLRIENGLLTVLLLLSGFSCNVALLFTNALQGLKKFRTLAFVNFIGAPIRLATMLVAMPFRALSGYILGQTTPPAAISGIALFSLRKEFHHIPVDKSWRKDIPSMLRYAGPVAVWIVGCALYNTAFSTIIRQRLPEIESAAYYLLTRFAEIGGYIGLSATVILFPLASESHERKREDNRALTQTVIASIAFSALVAIAFIFVGNTAFSIVPVWHNFLPFVHLLAPLTLTVGISYATGAYVTYEMACRRFGPVWIIIVMNLFWVLTLIIFAGCEFFRGFLPDSIVNWMSTFNVCTLSFLSWSGLTICIIQFCLVAICSTSAQKRVHA